MKISLVIPAYNEAEGIKDTLDELECYMNGYRKSDDWEIIVVNDGSTDATVDICEEIGREKPWLKVVDLGAHYGRGRALRKGLETALGEIIVSFDADLSYAPCHIEKLAETLQREGGDIVLASAYGEGGTVKNVPLKRLWVSIIGNKILSYMFGGEVTVLTCLARAYRKDFIGRLDLNSDDKEIHLEILFKARTLGGKILEIPADLNWRQSKLAKACNDKGTQRRSTMKFRKTSNSHMFFALMSKPGFIFLVPGFVLMTIAFIILYSKFWLIMKAISLGEPAYDTIRNSMKSATPSWMAVIVFTILAVQFFALSFMTNQIKRVYEEIYKTLNAIFVHIEKKK